MEHRRRSLVSCPLRTLLLVALSCGVACDSGQAPKADAKPAPASDAKASAVPDSTPTPAPAPAPASDSPADPAAAPAAESAGDKPAVAPKPSAPPEPAAGASVVFDLGPLVDGRFTPIATLTFDAAQNGTLKLVGSNPKHADLEKAWAAAAKLEEVSVKRGRESPDGTHELVGVTTTRGGKDFPIALANYVADEVGMFAVPR